MDDNELDFLNETEDEKEKALQDSDSYDFDTFSQICKIIIVYYDESETKMRDTAVRAFIKYAH